MRRLIRLIAVAAMTCSTLVWSASEAAAQGADPLLDMASRDGDCRVTVMPAGASTLYVPESRDPSERFNVLVWGNGTGGDANTYRTLLTSIASQCIFVAAANTANSRSGREMQAAFTTAMQRFGRLIREDPRVCTAGHSQGGGATFNAAPLVDADCGIAVQPDTVNNGRIARPLSATVELIALTSTNDVIAPRQPNRGNINRNTPGALVEIQTADQTHFAPTQGRAGRIGDVFRAAAIAQLSNSPERAAQFRALFFGAPGQSTISTNTRGIAAVDRNQNAVQLQR